MLGGDKVNKIVSETMLYSDRKNDRGAEKPKAKDCWDKLDVIAKALIPIALLAGGYFSTAGSILFPKGNQTYELPWSYKMAESQRRLNFEVVCLPRFWRGIARVEGPKTSEHNFCILSYWSQTSISPWT
jgi:hypothetical protein